MSDFAARRNNLKQVYAICYDAFSKAHDIFLLVIYEAFFLRAKDTPGLRQELKHKLSYIRSVIDEALDSPAFQHWLVTPSTDTVTLEKLLFFYGVKASNINLLTALTKHESIIDHHLSRICQPL